MLEEVLRMRILRVWRWTRGRTRILKLVEVGRSQKRNDEMRLVRECGAVSLLSRSFGFGAAWFHRLLSSLTLALCQGWD
jgi:hypothetical protein